ncbi:hypothetical protein N0V90_013106, partial [Kalmusia sp. IMI 367209]
IDAICINQADKEEQGQQVQQMGEIYKHAERVLFWLGKATPEIITLMDMLDQYRRFSASHDPGQWTLDDNRKEDHRDVLGESRDPGYTSQGIAVVNNPALFVIEKRPERYHKDQETCCSQAVKLILDVQANKASEYQEYDDGLRVISWGSVEQNVKILLIHDKKKAILRAALQGFGQIVKQLLRMKVGAEVAEEWEGSALQEAIKQEHTRAVHTIVHQYSYMNAQAGKHSHALYAAVDKGNGELIRVLINAGADVNAQSGKYHNTLHAAIAQATINEQVIKLLVDAGANFDGRGSDTCRKVLQVAILQGREQLVRLLLQAGADVNAQGGDFGNALQVAAFKGDEKIVKLLLKAGADVNAQGGQFGNALQAAAFKGDEQLVRLLLNEGANVNAHGGRYGNALHAATYERHGQVVKLLVNAGADVNAQVGRNIFWRRLVHP